MSLSVSADTMSNLCVKTIVEHGSRLDRLIYGVGALVHHAVCFEQKQSKFQVCPTRHCCHVIVSSLLVISIVVVVVVVVIIVIIIIIIISLSSSVFDLSERS